MEYGYLPKSDMETGNLRTEDQLNEAIKSLQRFANIPETGVMDDATRRMISRPRCGLPDNTNTGEFSAMNELRSRRRKRYSIQGPKWSSTSVTWR